MPAQPMTMAPAPSSSFRARPTSIIFANVPVPDADDAEGFRALQRRQYAAFGDAEHRPIGSFAADMQTRVAVAGDHEGGGAVIALDQPAQRHRHAVDVGLALDPVRSLGQRRADDL